MQLQTLLFIGGIGGGEMLMIFLIIMIFFGAKKIPDLARGLGKGIREFKEASKEVTSELDKELKEIKGEKA